MNISQKHIAWILLVAALLSACHTPDQNREEQQAQAIEQLRDSLIEDFSSTYRRFEMEVGSTARRYILEAQLPSDSGKGQAEVAQAEVPSAPKPRPRLAEPAEKPATLEDVATADSLPAEGGPFIASLAPAQSSILRVDSPTPEVMRSRTEAQFQVFVCAGSTRELLDRGILERRGKISEGLSLEQFDLRDRRFFHSMRWQGKRGRVLTDHPEDSYEWVDHEGEVELKILDKQTFWRDSYQLVISVD
mgnify:CR=1